MACVGAQWAIGDGTRVAVDVLMHWLVLFVGQHIVIRRDESGRSCRGTFASLHHDDSGTLPQQACLVRQGRDGGLRSDSMTAPTASTCEGETLPKLPLAPQRLSRKSAAVIAARGTCATWEKSLRGLGASQGRAAKLSYFGPWVRHL